MLHTDRQTEPLLEVLADLKIMSVQVDKGPISQNIEQHIGEVKEKSIKEKSSEDECPKLDFQIPDKSESKGDTTQEKSATKEHSTQYISSVKLTQEVLYGLETIIQPKLDAIETLLQERLHQIEIMLQGKLEQCSQKKLEAVECEDASQLKRREAAKAAVDSPADRWEAIEVLSPRDIGQIEMCPDQYEKVKDLEFTEG